MVGSFTLSTGFGSWNAIFWLAAFIVAMIIGWIIWRRGEGDHPAGKDGAAPYLSGNKEPEKGAVHIRGGNLYWGYTDALSGYYRWIKPLHTGNASDYVLAYLAVTALLLVMVVIFR